MRRVAALLRAINAGVTLPMADLRAFLTAQGLGEVRTLLASGNAVFATDRDPAELESALETAAREGPGIDTRWYLRTHDDLSAIIAANPFADAAVDRPNLLLVQFHRQPVTAPAHAGPERLHAVGRELFIDHVENVGRSKLPQVLRRAGLHDGTGRNWNTVLRLREATSG